MQAPRLARGEVGAAVADFVMVSALVTAMFLAVFQVGLALHIRNTLVSCASEGARLGARADAEPGLAQQRTQTLISQSLSPRFAEHVSAGVVEVAGVRAVAVDVTSPLPVLGPWGPHAGLHVVGRAFLERQ